MRRTALLMLAGLAAAFPARADDGFDRLLAIDRANPGWLARGKAEVPPAWTAGRLYRLDEAALKAHVAVFPTGADLPATPGNPFDPGQVLVIELARDGDGFAYAGSTIHTRSPNDRLRSPNEDDHAAILEELYAQAEAEPGIVPCRIRGWALSDSSAGTPVRAAPADAAAIVGRLAPPHRAPVSEAAPVDGWRTEFAITGYHDGWFRIAGAEPPGAPYGDPPPPDHPGTYAGTGWIRATEATGAYANSQMPVPRLMQSPHVDAQDRAPREAAADYFADLSIDGTLVGLHACAANWALTTSRDGQRGWWRGICSNQATNCS